MLDLLTFIDYSDVDASVQFSLKLLVDPEDDNGISIELLKEIVESSEETPELDDIFIEAIQDLSTRLSKLDMSSEYKPYNIVSIRKFRRSGFELTWPQALNRIISSKKLANMFIRDPMFLPSTVTGPTIETDTLLGPYFRISPCQVAYTHSYIHERSTDFDAAKSGRCVLLGFKDEVSKCHSRCHKGTPFNVTEYTGKTYAKKARTNLGNIFRMNYSKSPMHLFEYLPRPGTGLSTSLRRL